MKRLFQWMAILLAVLWLPITAHCSLETLPGLEFLLCGSDSGKSDKDCSGDACAQIERPSYKVSDTDTSVPEPPSAFWFELVFADIIPARSPRPSTAAPPEIPFGWQFLFRTASPPRAPSFVS